MANKADRQYFENFIEASDYTCQASKYLVECLNNFNLDNIKAMLDTMHEFEHQGDDKHHEMSAMLAKAFVTPVDREDLAMISQCSAFMWTRFRKLFRTPSPLLKSS